MAKYFTIFSIFLISFLIVFVIFEKSDSMKKIEWITENSNLSYDGQQLPKIAFAYEVQLDRILGPLKEKGKTVMGVYITNQNLIILNYGIEEYSEIYDIIVIHELVHFLQKLENKETCAGNLEYQAYTIQNRYMDYIGSKYKRNIKLDKYKDMC